MKISLITPTGDRPEAFALCEQWMMRQTLPYYEWIVVDDGETPTKINLATKVIRHAPQKRNTQGANLRSALKAAKGDVFAIIEDDDWYHPNYLKETTKHIGEDFWLVGENRANYYHVGISSFRTLKNFSYACLCQTVMKCGLGAMLEVITMNHQDNFDKHFWNSFSYHKKLLPGSQLVVGMKGMPGRPGGGQWHGKNEKQWEKDDPTFSKLQELVGSDFQYYLPFLK